MNFLMNKIYAEGQSIKVPDGLKELMFDISREVLRDQPENINEFIADYLEEMVLKREHRGVTKNILDMVIDESLTIYELVQASGLSLDCAKKTSKMIEKTFINYLQKKSNPTVGDEHSVVNEKEVCQKIMESCDLKRDEESKLRKIVQTCFKNFYFRQKSFEFKLDRLPDSHWANRAEKTLDLYRKTAPEKWQLERAAVVIQSAYRSYFVRKMPKDLQKFNKCATIIQSSFRGYMGRKSLDQANIAATIIQASFRGYLQRKSLLSSISSLQKIQSRTAIIGLIRSLVRKMVNDAIGVMDFEPHEDIFAFIFEIVNKIIINSMPDEMKEVVETASANYIEDVTRSSMDSVIFERRSNECSTQVVAATNIQRAFRGYIVRRNLLRKIDCIHKILNKNRTEVEPTFDLRIIEQQLSQIIDSIQDTIQISMDMGD